MSSSIRVAVDLVVFTVAEEQPCPQVVLVRLARGPFAGSWALPGGLIGPDERTEDAAARELREKTGLMDAYIEQLYTFSDPARDPTGRCISVAHLALVPSTHRELHTTPKYSGIAWFPLAGLPRLGYDHQAIVDTAAARLRGKLSYTNIAYSLLPDEFTLAELQRLYETILGKPLDPRNFRRRLAELELVQETEHQRQKDKGRPARLYRFTSRRPQTIQQFSQVQA